MKKIRRQDRAIVSDEAMALLSRCGYGVLSTTDQAAQPYGVPLHYVYKNNCLYFHCALTGHKIENINGNPKVSFCVVGSTKVLPADFATEYESAVAFGVVSEVQGTERDNALLWLLDKYSAEFIEKGKKYIEQYGKVTKVIKIEIEHVSGKARR